MSGGDAAEEEGETGRLELSLQSTSSPRTNAGLAQSLAIRPHPPTSTSLHLLECRDGAVKSHSHLGFDIIKEMAAGHEEPQPGQRKRRGRPDLRGILPREDGVVQRTARH